MSEERGNISYASDDMNLEHLSSSVNGLVDVPVTAVFETPNRNIDVRSNTLNIEEIPNPAPTPSRTTARDIIRPNQLLRVRFNGTTTVIDRYRDMRLDIDNMSYEELLALGDGIGNVCTGVSEEIISKRLKQQKYKTNKKSPEVAETCCICQEEYAEGEDMGILECGHEFHTQCIKEWLKRKNLCPFCKATGLNIVKKRKIRS